MNTANYIAEQDFDLEWCAHAKSNGELFNWSEILQFPLDRAWTVYANGSVDDLGNEDMTWYAMPGVVPGWAIGYLVTERSWSVDTPHAIWYLDDASEDELEERRQFNLELKS